MVQVKVLITGGTGSLGTELVKACIERGYSPIALGHSEKRIQSLKLKFNDIPVYCGDILNIDRIYDICKNNNVDYIIHAAAMKYVGICENNPGRAVDINITGSRNLITICKKLDIKNMIAVSTDKAINPSCVYGCTKLLMENLVLENGYSIIQGVNFLFSSGSVLELWDKAVSENRPILINARNATRYFVETCEMARQILDNLDMKGCRISLKKCYNVNLHELSKAFINYHNYNKTDNYDSFSVEKITEETPEGVEIIETNVKLLQEIIERYYNGY